MKEITLPKSFTDQTDKSAKLSCMQHFKIYTTQWILANKYIFSLASREILGRAYQEKNNVSFTRVVAHMWLTSL